MSSGYRPRTSQSVYHLHQIKHSVQVRNSDSPSTLLPQLRKKCGKRVWGTGVDTLSKRPPLTGRNSSKTEFLSICPQTLFLYFLRNCGKRCGWAISVFRVNYRCRHTFIIYNHAVIIVVRAVVKVAH